jgi:hypothetical protein
MEISFSQILTIAYIIYIIVLVFHYIIKLHRNGNDLSHGPPESEKFFDSYYSDVPQLQKHHTNSGNAKGYLSILSEEELISAKHSENRNSVDYKQAERIFSELTETKEFEKYPLDSKDTRFLLTNNGIKTINSAVSKVYSKYPTVLWSAGIDAAQINRNSQYVTDAITQALCVFVKVRTRLEGKFLVLNFFRADGSEYQYRFVRGLVKTVKKENEINYLFPESGKILHINTHDLSKEKVLESITPDVWEKISDSKTYFDISQDFIALLVTEDFILAAFTMPGNRKDCWNIYSYSRYITNELAVFKEDAPDGENTDNSDPLET